MAVRIQNDHLGNALSSTLGVNLKVSLLIHGDPIRHQTRTSGSHLGRISSVSFDFDRERTLRDVASRVFDYHLVLPLDLGHVGHGVGQVLVVVEATICLLLLSVGG